MKYLFYLFIFISTIAKSFAQTQDAWIYFKDKPNAATFYANPLDMLSQRAINRRSTQGIALDNKDIPIYQPYYEQIKNTSGIVVKAKSKWMNCVHVQGELSTIQSLSNIAFVDSIEFADRSLNNRNRISPDVVSKKLNNKLDVLTDFNYGNAANQINMLNGQYLHQNNFTGSGMHIAVMDAGFTNVNTAGGFQRLFQNNQILGTYNYVDRIEDVYNRHYHGTMVLSTMGGYIENQYVGTAPDASYYLFTTEDVNEESPVEMSYWVEAAEKADSLGVDVLNTSLGYTTFDNSAYDFTYHDLNGQTAFMSRGAEIAFSKGMLVVNSAGNSGNDAWHYIGVPADAVSILSIGAVDASEIIASFSSWGPTSDGRIKPDVCAQGQGSAVINTSNQIVNANGTSFSGPILAGTATCFWQAFPNKTNAEIARAIKTSADKFNYPDDHYGFGIPDFQIALNNILNLEKYEDNSFKIYPNPTDVNKYFFIQFSNANDNTLLIINDISGRTVYKEYLKNEISTVNTFNFKQGIYFINITTANNLYTKKLIIN